ncbi:MAG: hypothetical protein ACI9UV_001729, partial [Algoriphagus sp.]
MRYFQLYLIIIVALVAGCREPFEPEIAPSDLNVLV